MNSFHPSYGAINYYIYLKLKIYGKKCPEQIERKVLLKKLLIVYLSLILQLKFNFYPRIKKLSEIKNKIPEDPVNSTTDVS